MPVVRNSRNIYLLAAFALALLQSNSFGKSLTVAARYFNSSNGYSILPNEIHAQSVETSQSITISQHQLAERGSSAIELDEGNWGVTIFANGFQPMTARIDASREARYDFYLDPIQPPTELQSSSIERLHRSDATVVVGFVVDDETGLPLRDVVIRSTSGEESRTNDRGYYQIYLSLATDNSIIVARQGYQTEIRTNIETWANGDWIYNFRMKRGEGSNLTNESKSAQGEKKSDECVDCNKSQSQQSPFLATIVLSNSIKVGTNCTGTSCTTVEVHMLDAYAKRVLPAEWYSCWGSLANGANSLQAGAVAIRSYGLWYVYNPISSLYDICSTTSCQAFGTATSTNANNAVDATTRYILTNTGMTAVMRSEYSAENNNKGCGDGFTGTGTSWPCIYDPVCSTQTPNGHGRGMCQWGTARWANGTRVLTTSPCSAGVSHGFGTKTWQQMLAHYYPSYVLVQGASATIQSATANPNSIPQNSSFTIQYSINATDPFPVMLGASIAPTGTTMYTSNPANDVKVNLASGANSPSRTFAVPIGQTTGGYDLYVTLWYDKNNNNTIDGSDFIVNSQTYTAALTVTVLPVQLVSFTARVVATRNVELNWRTISEINNYGFFVQKRRAEIGEQWSEIPASFVAGHGTTNIPHDYEFTEVNAPNGTWQYRLRQVDLDGSEHFNEPVQVSIVTSVAEVVPNEFMLYQNYPNPFNPETKFQFSIVNTQLTTLSVFDILGREVAILVNKPLSTGVHSVSWNAAGIPSGVYSYRLSSGGRSATRKLILLR